jgi:hypothetical protein
LHSLSPSSVYATLPHGSYATPLRRFSFRTPASTPPRCRCQTRVRRVSRIHSQCPTAFPRLQLRYADHPRATLGFSNWAVQHRLEAATGPEGRRKIVACMWYVICPLLSLPCTNADDLIVDLPTATGTASSRRL